MKAYSHTCYGPASTALQFADVAKPVPKDDEVLVRVRAASVNPLDWHTIHGVPYLARFSMGIGKPEAPRVGVDYAGVVEAVGAKVTRFKPGDEVFGGRTGAFAEYVVVREERNVVPKPANVSFAEAAAIPVAAITALQAVRDKGRLQAGEKVLVVGASGGVGTYAVQIAKALGAEVTAVCSTRNLELVQSLGADHVVDYTKEDVAKGDARYDLIVDMVSTSGPRELDRILTPAGRVIVIGGAGGPEQRWLGPMSAVLAMFAMRPFLDHDMQFMLAELNPKDLAYLADLMATGRMRSAIDRTYTLAELPQALDYLEKGRARGKVIVAMDAAPLAQQ
jgi:NADPH:quinone reductase-like Zn-dependent oxidoreductase